MPRVSVIIPTYNWSRVLPYSIGSVLRQSFVDWELLVIGDACTDNSPEVVAQMQKQDAQNRIRWINLPVNIGSQSGPNNAGLAQARGEFVAYLGHDDLWLPHHLELLVAALDEGADLAHTVVRWVVAPGEEAHPLYFAANRLTTPSSTMHRRSVTQQIGGWRNPQEIGGFPDVDLWNRMEQAGFKTAFVPRLSVIKISASNRRDVYKTRPSHEQAAWFERLNDADLETSQFVEMLCEASPIIERLTPPPPPGFATDLKNMARANAGFLRRTLRRLRPRKPRELPPIEASRVFRGLPPKP